MERIKARNRDAEKGISRDYLLSLEHKIEENINVINSDTKLIVINSNKFDYVSNLTQQNEGFAKNQTRNQLDIRLSQFPVFSFNLVTASRLLVSLEILPKVFLELLRVVFW